MRTVLKLSAAVLVAAATFAPTASSAMEAGNGTWLSHPRCASPAPFAGGACLAVWAEDPADPDAWGAGDGYTGLRWTRQ